MNRAITTGFVVVAGTLVAALTGCNGNSTTPSPAPVFTPVPFLVPGTTSNFSGKFSEVITYASPSSKQPNSVGTYTTTDVQTVSSSPPGAPAPFHVHRQFKYTVVKIPTSGIELQTRTIDSFESSVVTGNTQTIALASTITANTGIDQTANRLEGNGPYAYTSTNAIAYASPRVLYNFPLMQGSSNLSLARTEKLMEHASTSGNVFLNRNTTSTYANTGAFHTTGTIAKGETTDVTANANGSASVLNQGISPLTETIGLPTAINGSYVIPVTRESGSITQKYLAADWYPGNAAPPLPLAGTAETVVGPATIPAACGITTPLSNVDEVTGSSTTLNVVAGTYTSSQSQTYLANNLVVCRITSSKTLTYAIETGGLISTIADTFAEGLTSTSKT